MKSLQFILLLLLMQQLLSCAPAQDTKSDWLVGVASAPVNPTMGAFIAGDKQNRQFTGIRDSLYAKAVVVTDGSNAIAIITIDCIGLLYPDINKIREKAAAAVKNLNLPAERIIVASTHTHSGPDVVGLWGVDYTQSGVDSAYMALLVETAAAQVVLAAANMVAATAATSEITFGEGWVANISDSEIDRSVTTLQFLDMEGNSLATLTNFACHPTFLDANYSDVSADFVGAFYKDMQAKLGGEHLFLQGAIGGWVQPVDENKTHEMVDIRGVELANAVQTGLSTANPLKGKGIDFRSSKFTFAVENEAWRQLAAMGTINRQVTETIDTEVCWFRIGEAQFATHPGETTPWHGLQTKAMMTTGPKFVIGLGQDALGYILKPIFFEDSTQLNAGYLTSMSLGKSTGPKLMEELEQVITPKE